MLLNLEIRLETSLNAVFELGVDLLVEELLIWAPPPGPGVAAISATTLKPEIHFHTPSLENQLHVLSRGRYLHFTLSWR